MLLFKPGTTRPYASVPVTANRWPRLTPGRVCVNTKYEADNCILELADFRKGGEVQKWLPFAELQVSVEHVKVSDRGGQVIWLERKSGCIGLFDVDAKKRKTFQPKVEPDDQVEDIAISPDGALLAWGTRRTLCLMDTRSGKEIRKDTLKGDMGTEAIEFTPDAKTLIAFCWRVGIVRVPVHPKGPSPMCRLPGQCTIARMLSLPILVGRPWPTTKG